MNTTNKTIRTGLVKDNGSRMELSVGALPRGRVLVTVIVVQADGYRLPTFSFEADASQSDADLVRTMRAEWSTDNYGPGIEGSEDNGWKMEVQS